jgi:hypothetical protein
MHHLMDSILELGQWAATAVELRSTAIQDDQLSGVSIQMVVYLQGAGNHAHRGVVPPLNLDTVKGIKAEQKQAPAFQLFQAAILQLARTPPGSRSARTDLLHRESPRYGERR